MAKLDNAGRICEIFQLPFLESPLWEILLIKVKGQGRVAKIRRRNALSSLENIGDAILGLVTREIVLESNLDGTDYDQLKSNEMLQKLSEEMKLNKLFPRKPADCMEVLFAILYELYGFGKTRLVIRKIYFSTGKLIELETPCLADEKLSNYIVNLIFKQYMRQLFPETDGFDISNRTDALKVPSLLRLLAEKAFNLSNVQVWEKVIADAYERHGFEFTKEKIISALPQHLFGLQELVRLHNQVMVSFFDVA